MSPSKLLRLSEVGQILVIRPDLEFLWMTLKIMPVLLERTDNREQLFVVYLIITFVNVERLGEEGNWMPQRIAWVQLAQYCAGSEITSVGRQSERVDIIWNSKYGSRCKGLFQRLERSLLRWLPNPRLILLGKVDEWPGNLGKVLNEPAIEIRKA